MPLTPPQLDLEFASAKEAERFLSVVSALLKTYHHGHADGPDGSGLLYKLEVGTSARGVEVCATHPLKGGGLLVVSKGSVVGFRGDAIVNAANEECLSGGGVDGAITRAGGQALALARRNLPLLSASVRCRTGGAVMTVGGSLKATSCIHAVGPNYAKYGGDLERADADLRSAYTAAVAIAHEQGLTTVGFSLICAGIYRKPRSLEAVLEIACQAIVDEGELWRVQRWAG